MDHSTLSPEQYAPVIAKLMAHRDDLDKLLKRMTANRFPADDPLFVAVLKAWEAASHACVAACGCRNAVHGPPGGSLVEREREASGTRTAAAGSATPPRGRPQ